MAFKVHIDKRPAAGLDGTWITIEEPDGPSAEIWLELGFNCISWQVPWNGQRLELLYADPHLRDNPVPTRSGFPILFPFPNRIRDGHFTWNGTAYQLPLNDPAKKNAIHGFACRRPWKLANIGTEADSAAVSAEFSSTSAPPDIRASWPADYLLRVTYRLRSHSLRVEAEVHNPGPKSLPFGLGYHPYFRVPLVPGRPADSCVVETAARSYWELSESLPTGSRKPLTWRQPQPYSALTLDDLFTDREALPGDLLPWGGVRQLPEGIEVRVLAAPAFRDLVVFTAPHRQAICLEPYTCPTDAINLQARGLDAGWLVLPPGESWSAAVEVQFVTP